LSGADWEQQYVNEIMPHKIAIELDYLARRTLVRDLELMLRTLLVRPLPQYDAKPQNRS
jgi:lipopolysaccharide/colanic/teichoic acid biosynthesis glycosyltransferase